MVRGVAEEVGALAVALEHEGHMPRRVTGRRDRDEFRGDLVLPVDEVDQPRLLERRE